MILTKHGLAGTSSADGIYMDLMCPTLIVCFLCIFLPSDLPEICLLGIYDKRGKSEASRM